MGGGTWLLLLVLRLLLDPMSPIVTGVTSEGEGTMGVSNFESIGRVICLTNKSFGRLGRGGGGLGIVLRRGSKNTNIYNVCYATMFKFD